MNKVEKKKIWITCISALVAMVIAEPSYAIIASANLEYRKINPVKLNRFAALDTSDQTNWKSNGKNERFIRSHDVHLFGGFHLLNTKPIHVSVGLYGRYSLPQKVVQEGETSNTNILIVKTTAINNTVAGPSIRGSVDLPFSLSLFAEGGAGAGANWIKQTINNGTEHTLEADAFSVEVFGEAGLAYNLIGPAYIQVYGGYAWQKSSLLKVKSTSGSLYSALHKNDVLATSYNGKKEDLTIDRTGLYGGLGLTISL